MRRYALAAFFMFVACAAASCEEGNGRPYTDNAPSYRERLAALTRSSFRVTYSYDNETNDGPGRLVWTRSGSVDRWDDIYERNGTVAAASALLDSDTGDAWYCYWTLSETVDAYCEPSIGGPVNDTFGKFIFPNADGMYLAVEYAGDEEVLGRTAACFKSLVIVLVRGEMCMTDDGLPLLIDVKDSLGRLQLDGEATHIGTPTGDWQQPVIPLSRPYSRVDDAEPEDLFLLPIADAVDDLRADE